MSTTWWYRSTQRFVLRAFIYIQDMKFVPATSGHLGRQETTAATTTATMMEARRDAQECDTQRISHVQCVQWNSMDDFGYDGITSTFHDYIPTPTGLPLTTTTVLDPTTATMSKVEQDVWHQRLAHCSERKMKLTQKYVDGIPTFQQTKIPLLVRCRVCDIAILKKAPRGPTAEPDLTLHPGQVFQMDIGKERLTLHRS